MKNGESPRARRAVRVLIADDHEVVRIGVRTLLEAEGFKVVGEAADGRRAVELAASLKPDILVLDIVMPSLNGIEAARRIVKAPRAPEILIFSSRYSERLAREALEAGARGFVLKSDSGAHLVRAVEALADGRPYFSGEVSRQLLDSFVARTDGRPVRAGRMGTLTPREQEIIQLLAEGKSNKQVAVMLGISVKTVETHRTNFMRKLGLHGLSDLIHYALRNNLIVV